jgi:transcriptional regulator with XRE-family HTH domain
MTNATMTRAAKIGARIHEIRTRYRLTLAQFAKHLDVTAGTVANWESGGSVKHNDLARIVLKFDVDPDWLLMGAPAGRIDQDLSKARTALVNAVTLIDQAMREP